MLEIASTLRVLGDETRLRIVRLLKRESLNVGELTRILGLAQPTVSKHLAELKRAGVVEGSRSAGYSYYCLCRDVGRWWKPFSETLDEGEDEKGDLVRLGEVLRQRTERHEPDRFVVPGRSWTAWSRALQFLLPSLRVADFGCGDGFFTVELARWARKVYAIDSNRKLLSLARERASDCSNVRFLEEDMSALSLPEQSVDLVVISQSLHYVENPQAVLAEAFRILSPGGRLLLLDLLPHEQDWVVSELRHHWMGFEPERLKRWIRKTGFKKVAIDPASRGPEPFRTVVATGVRT